MTDMIFFVRIIFFISHISINTHEEYDFHYLTNDIYNNLEFP